MEALLNGQEIDAACLCVNDGLTFGRFDRLEGPILDYEMRLTLAELSARMEEPWNRLVAEMRVDDRLDEEPSALKRMNYPTFTGAFAFPKELREVIATFLDVEILKTFVPISSQSDFVINSADSIVVGSDGLVFSGRCFKRRLP